MVGRGKSELMYAGMRRQYAGHIGRGNAPLSGPMATP